MKNILEKIDEAIASDVTSEETKKLLIEIREELTNAKTELKVLEIVAALVKIFTGLF